MYLRRVPACRDGQRGAVGQGANYPINSTFAEIAAEAPIMIYRIPEAETSVNSAITEADNNPAAMAPTPVN